MHHPQYDGQTWQPSKGHHFRVRFAPKMEDGTTRAVGIVKTRWTDDSFSVVFTADAPTMEWLLRRRTVELCDYAGGMGKFLVVRREYKSFACLPDLHEVYLTLIRPGFLELPS